jgi:hypothetical protein
VAGARVILGSDTVTILRGRTRDNFGNLQGSDTATDVTGCSVQPTSASESTERGELLVTNATAYLPAGTDILGTDRVRWLGDVYAVNGTPDVWRDQTGAVSHVQAQLLLKEGQG